MYVRDLKIDKNSSRILQLAACSVFFIILASCAATKYEPYKGFPQKTYGVASWYGADFHGKPTSSGEIYNMHANTCAHKEYSFGTRLRVTNISNNKSVECIVNDRGPFVSGRDLDLSYACAKEIGLIGAGTGKVKIEHMGRDMRYVREVLYFSGINHGPFTIQVGSFKEMPNATRLKAALDYRYENVYIAETNIKGEVFYRVRIGKFEARNDAESLAKMLADEGYSILIAHYDEKI